MGSSAASTDLPSPDFLRVFAEYADPEGAMPFDMFMRLALYHPNLGYYRRPKERVGYGSGTDFFTSSTSGPVFGELIAAAAVKLLGGRDPKQHTFVEIGAEPGRGVMTGVDHPFAAVRTVSPADALELSGPLVVFSNELFDAQPFRRFRVVNGQWRELGVALEGESLVDRVLEAGAFPLPAELPDGRPNGYTIDAPLAAARLAESISAQPWAGVFMACDYGKTWQEICEATPAGTARAYFRHTQSNDLLAHPGTQDLTCHICWDWLCSALTRHEFKEVAVDSQESFFIRNSESYLAPAIAADAERYTARKQSLLQLLHGSHLGHKFQVLHGLR